MPTARELKDRWRGTGQMQARGAVERLLDGSPLEDLELGTVDGRVDLRGLWLARTKGLKGLPDQPLATVPTASGVRWGNIDFSRSTFVINVDDVVVENVRFDHVGWRDWNVRSSVLRDCTFAGADLREVQFDGNSGLQDRAQVYPPTALVRCDFSRTTIGAYGGFGRADVSDCRFANTRFPSPMWFRGADLRGCTFTGRFRTVCFGWTGPFEEPAPWLDADVSDAEFEPLEVYAHRGPGLTRS